MKKTTIRPTRLLEFHELKTIHGIGYTREHLRRLEAQKKFPKRVTLGEGKRTAIRVGWYQEEIEAFLAAKLVGRAI